MTSNEIIVESTEKRVKTIRFNRPDRLNSFTITSLRAFNDAIDTISEDPKIRVVIITGEGRAFSTGNDVRAGMDAAAAREAQVLGRDIVFKLMYMPQITIAAINGLAVGGGFEIALGCDLRVAAEGAEMGLPELKYGMPPAWAGWNLLAKITGTCVANELLIIGDFIDAGRAKELGIVARVYPPEPAFMDHVLGLAGDLRRRDVNAIALTSFMVNQSMEIPLSETTKMASEIFDIFSQNKKNREREIARLRQAFLEKLLRSHTS